MNNKDEEITKLKEKIKENELKISNSNKYINELQNKEKIIITKRMNLLMNLKIEIMN